MAGAGALSPSSLFHRTLGHEERMLVKTMKKLFGSDDDKGPSALEYGLLGALIAAVIGIDRSGPRNHTVDSFFAGLGTAMVMAIGK